MTTTTLPNLAGVIKTTDIYKKMKFDYVAWAKTAQIMREHAPGWQFCLCLLYTSPSPRDRTRSRMPSSA